MKYSSLLIILLFSLNTTFAQQDPVSWIFEAEKISEGEYQLLFIAEIDQNWNIYSQFLESDEGPIPTEFVYNENQGLELIGKNEENGHRKEAYDELFEMNVIKFSDKVAFSQIIKVNENTKSIEGYVTYMTCDNTRCLPPKDVDFSIVLK